MTVNKDDYELKTNLTDLQRSMIGKIYNRLQVVGFIGKPNPSYHDRYYLCQCSCGNYAIASKYQLEHNVVKSCGCLHSDVLVTRNFKHGLTKDPRYGIATAILRRVNGTDEESRKWYADKGIKCELGDTPGDVCLNLLKVPGYFEGASIDRIDGDGNYTIWHNEHGYNEWEFDDPVLNIKSKCIGNLRWLSIADNTRRHAAKPVNLYETKPVTKSFFQRYCNEHGLNFEDYEMSFSGLITPGNKLKQYYFKKKIKLEDEQSKVQRSGLCRRDTTQK